MTRIDAAEQTRVFRVQVSPDGEDWHRSSHSPEDHATAELAATAALAVHHRSPDLQVRVVEVVTITTPVRWVVPATTTPVQLSSLFVNGDSIRGAMVLGDPATITPRCQWHYLGAALDGQCTYPAVDGSPFCAIHSTPEA